MAAWCAVALVVALILMLVTVNYEQPGWSTVVLAASIAALHYGKVIDVTHSGHYVTGILMWTAIYLAVGVAWSVARWSIHVQSWSLKLRQDIQAFRADFMRAKGLVGDAIPESLKGEWKSYLSEQSRDNYSYRRKRRSAQQFSSAADIQPLKVIDHIGQLVTWIVYWPFSVLWWAIDDVVAKIAQWFVVVVIGQFLQSMSNGAAKKVHQELEK